MDKLDAAIIDCEASSRLTAPAYLAWQRIKEAAKAQQPAAAVPEGDKLTDTDVFTLIGDAHVRRGRGEDDLPSYELDLARRIAVALGDRALAERCEQLAAAERKGVQS